MPENCPAAFLFSRERKETPGTQRITREYKKYIAGVSLREKRGGGCAAIMRFLKCFWRFKNA